jgi:N-acetylglucosamine kinase-like BadF-type ATPase
MREIFKKEIMKYLIGIDGGGTSSRCVICDENGKVLYRCKGGPTNFLKYDINGVCKTIYSLLNKCRQNLKITYNDINVVVIGTAGAGRRKDALLLIKNLKRFLESKKISLRLRVVSDGLIALEGAFSGKSGSILISGTGSIIFGKDKKGKVYRLGGYGNKIGDEGSGYSIGQKGLNAVSKDFDGRAKKTLLTKYLKENFKIDSGEKLIQKIYHDDFDIASFAPHVLKAADKRDEAAIEILERESGELILHIERIIKLLKSPKMKLALIGSLIANENLFSKLLKEKIDSNFSNIEIVEPENLPEIGALILAQKL